MDYSQGDVLRFSQCKLEYPRNVSYTRIYTRIYTLTWQPFIHNAIARVSIPNCAVSLRQNTAVISLDEGTSKYLQPSLTIWYVYERGAGPSWQEEGRRKN